MYLVYVPVALPSCVDNVTVTGFDSSPESTATVTTANPSSSSTLYSVSTKPIVTPVRVSVCFMAASHHIIQSSRSLSMILMSALLALTITFASFETSVAENASISSSVESSVILTTTNFSTSPGANSKVVKVGEKSEAVDKKKKAHIHTM